MTKKLKAFFSTLLCCSFLFTLLPANVQAMTLTNNATGTYQGYDYEYWKDTGNGTMTLTGPGTFTCSWSNINNILFRTGKKLGSQKTYQEYGNIYIEYACDYRPNGNSYLSVYGWTQGPLVEYYIIESYGTWKPPGSNQVKGYVNADGGQYEIYQTTRYNMPSIEGDKTFDQYWSVRTQKRTSGTISVHEHFKAWESRGMRMGRLYEVSMVVEGYQSSGQANMKKMNLVIGGQAPSTSTPKPVTEKNAFQKIEAEDYDDLVGSEARSIGTGIGYINNGDYAVYKSVNLGSGAGSFKAYVANGNTTSTTIQLRLGGTNGALIGTLTVPSTGGWDTYQEVTTNVTNASGTKDLYLCFSGPVNVDYFVFDTSSNTGGNNGGGGNTGGGNTGGGNNGGWPGGGWPGGGNTGGNTGGGTKTVTNNETGTHGGYNYEYWKDNGNGTMILKDGGSFSCEWSNINNILFRKGIKYDETKTHQQIGTMELTYECDYQPNGNSYLAVYGWTSDPLVEYYIIESWGNWRPPGNEPVKGTITVDGGTYDIYETTRVNQPSIKGTATFQQYWSVRQQKRTSGKISVSEHFKAWESRGMKMGKFYEISLVVEGYQSSGKADVKSMSISINGVPHGSTGGNTGGGNTGGGNTGGGNTGGGNTGGGNNGGGNTGGGNNGGNTGGLLGDVNNSGTIDSIDLAIYKQYLLGMISSFPAPQNADIDNDGNYTSIDFAMIKQHLLGMIDLTTRGNPNNGGNNGNPGNTSPIDAFSKIEAENYSSNSSSTMEKIGTDNGGSGLGYIENGDYIVFKNVNFGSGANSFTARVAYGGNSSTTIQLRLGSSTGTIIGSLNVTSTGGWDSYRELSTSVSGASGTKDLYLCFNGAVNIDYFTFSTQSVPTSSPTSQPITGKKLVALTFDDGPSYQTTLVLDKLKKYNAKATFMVVGQNIASNGSVMQRIVAEGHEIGNHSWSHQDMRYMSASQIQNEINQTNAAVRQYTGYDPKFFRAPNLSVGGAMTSTINMPFVQGVIAQDWNGGSATTAQARAQIVINGVRDGSIVLMHCTQPGNHPTPEALDIIIPTLQNQGYAFVTLSELFSAKGITPRPGVTYDGAF